MSSCGARWYAGCGCQCITLCVAVSSNEYNIYIPHAQHHGAGVVHAGMLGAAASVFLSASAAVAAAHQAEPHFDILVTGMFFF